MPVRFVWTLLAALVIVAGSGIASGADQTSAGQSHLSATSWSGSIYSHKAGGVVCWLSGEDGSLRAEISDTARLSSTSTSGNGSGLLEDLDSLLNRNGNGWTMILGPADTGTLNAWGREWRQVPQGLALMVRLLTVSLASHPGLRPEFSFASFAGPPPGWAEIPRPSIVDGGLSVEGTDDSWHYQLSSLELEENEAPGEMGFRGGMVTRGRGTGGKGEIVSLDWIPASRTDEYALEITSSRRPGTLRLDPVREIPVKTPEPEVFLPLWPLSQFLESK